MQLQLALDVADQLHQALLVRGEPLETREAVRVLLAADHAGSLCVEILETLVKEDNRFLWKEAGRAQLSLRSWEHPDPGLATVPFVAVDLETTGARPGLNKITEVGAVRIEGLRPVKYFRTLVNPLRPIPPMITRITGITSDMVADAPRIEEVLPPLLEFLKGAVVVAHNAPFDVGFLNYELGRQQGRKLDDGFVDTLPLARALAPGLPNYRLGTVAEALGAPVVACHRALEDARATAHIFLELTTRLQERGATRLDELRAHGRSSARGSLHKLGLTRDLPDRPGTFRFVGNDGEILLVGHAELLGEQVRSYFVSERRHSRKIDTAVRLVQRIDWQPASTPLEALVKEQRLVLKHRPPYNPYRSRPEEYVYIRAKSARSGLGLLATACAPRPATVPDTGRSCPGQDLAIGPFRRPSTVHSALHLIRSCYPIKCCPQNREDRPCSRGQQNLCLSPCTAPPAKLQEHDLLVAKLMWWLAGCSGPDLPDPLCRAEEVAWELARQERYDDARILRESCDNLLAIRRSYDALAEACGLSFACLWPLAGSGKDPSVRLNLVWRGVLLSPASLVTDAIEQQIDRALGPIRQSAQEGPPNKGPVLLSVPRKQLDSLLAVSRWFNDADRKTAVLITRRGSEPTHLLSVKSRLVAEARALLETGTPVADRPRPAD